MFWNAIYQPTTFSEICHNQQLINQLLTMNVTSIEDMNHLILKGPPESGKYTILRIWLKSLVPSTVTDRIQRSEFTVKHTTIMIEHTQYYYIIDLVQTPLFKKHVYFIDFIKQLCKTRNIVSQLPNVILIRHAELMNEIQQKMLRKIMETYSINCRFCFLLDSRKSLLSPIQSRCITMCVRKLTFQDSIQLLQLLPIEDEKKISNSILYILYTISEGRLSELIYYIQLYSLQPSCIILLDYNDTIHKICSHIEDQDFPNIIRRLQELQNNPSLWLHQEAMIKKLRKEYNQLYEKKWSVMKTEHYSTILEFVMNYKRYSKKETKKIIPLFQLCVDLYKYYHRME